MILANQVQLREVIRQFVYHYHIRRNNKHLIKRSLRSCREQDRLHNFAFQWLCHKYIYTYYDWKNHEHAFKFKRKFPTNARQKHYVVNAVKNGYKSKYYGMKSSQRWSGKKIHLASQVANVFIMKIVNDFGNYLLRLRRNDREMSTDAKAKYERKHNRSWIQIGSFNYIRRGCELVSHCVTIPNNKQIKVLGNYVLKVPTLRKIYTIENIKNLDSKRINQIKLKIRPSGNLDLQIVFNEPYRVNRGQQRNNAVGIDYNQTNNQILCLYDNVPNGYRGYIVKFRLSQYKKYEHLDNEIKDLQRKNQCCLVNTKSQHFWAVEAKINYFKVKQTGIIKEEYRFQAHWICEKYDTIIMEQLDAKSMRLRGRGNRKNRNINNRLKILQPATMLAIFQQEAQINHDTFIEVDAWKTSQVTYGTDEIIKPNKDNPQHEVKKYGFVQRYWKSKALDQRVYRDPNAAHNILDWGLYPKHHIKYRRYVKNYRHKYHKNPQHTKWLTDKLIQVA